MEFFKKLTIFSGLASIIAYLFTILMFQSYGHFADFIDNMDIVFYVCYGITALFILSGVIWLITRKKADK